MPSTSQTPLLAYVYECPVCESRGLIKMFACGARPAHAECRIVARFDLGSKTEIPLEGGEA
jgi:hypothetical protein